MASLMKCECRRQVPEYAVTVNPDQLVIAQMQFGFTGRPCNLQAVSGSQ